MARSPCGGGHCAFLHAKVVAFGNQDDVAAVERFERRAVADRDEGRARQLLRQQAIEPRFGRLVQGPSMIPVAADFGSTGMTISRERNMH